MKSITNINEVIKELKEYQDMQDALKIEIEKLKAEAIEYLDQRVHMYRWQGYIS